MLGGLGQKAGCGDGFTYGCEDMDGQTNNPVFNKTFMLQGHCPKTKGAGQVKILMDAKRNVFFPNKLSAKKGS